MSADLLALVQWLSPGFPTGAFAHSHGLERAVTAGEAADAGAVAAWIADIVRYGAGWSDAVLLARALDPCSDLAALSALARALAASSERLAEAEAQGAALAATVAAVTGRAVSARPLPVALGEAARGLLLPARVVVALYLHAFAANLVFAAVRFVPLGQTEGQRMLAALHPLILDLADRAAEAAPNEIGMAALGGDLAAIGHETMDVRIFRT